MFYTEKKKKKQEAIQLFLFVKRVHSVLRHDQNTQISHIIDQKIHRGRFDLWKGVVNLVTKALRDQRHSQQINSKELWKLTEWKCSLESQTLIK